MRRQLIVGRRRRELGSSLRLAGLALAGALLLIPAGAYAKDSKTISQKSSGSSKSSGSYSKSTSGSRASGSRATGSRTTGSRSSASSSRATTPSRSSSSARSGSASSVPERRTLFGRREARRPVRQNDGEQPPTVAGSDSGGESSATGSSHTYYGPTRHHGYYGGYWGHYHYYPHRYRYGYYPYFYGPYGHFYPYRRSYRDDMGALDLNVKPKKARVYIDGTPVGPVDRYDGFPSYLWLEAGTYDLAFYLEGHETLHRTYTVYPGVIADIDERMQPGAAVEPAPPEPTATAGGESRYGSYGDEPPRGREADQTGVGRLQLKVEPRDAAVYLDGHFLGTGEELSQLSAGVIVEPGRHVLELVRPGYQSREVPIKLSAGERLDLDFELEKR